MDILCSSESLKSISPTGSPTIEPTIQPTIEPTIPETSLLPTTIPSTFPTTQPTYDVATAFLTFHCDNAATVDISHDNKASWINVENTNTNEWEPWGTPFMFEMNVSMSTVLHVSCRDAGSVGGFIATLQYNGQNYSTIEPLNESVWELINSTDNVTSPLVYSSKTATPWRISTAEIASDAKWVWNGNVDNTMLFEFAFDGLVVTMAPSVQPTNGPTIEPTPAPDDMFIGPGL